MPAADFWREYHDATKHTREGLKRSRHFLDWANMPEPFRHYEGAPVLDLPADPPSPAISALAVLSGEHGHTPGVDGAAFLSQLLYYSAAISASKVVPSTGYRYALRVNPSSGNLHPTEFHFCTRGLQEWPDGLYHYRASSHMAEQRATGDFVTALAGENANLVFVLMGIAWREAWKYQDRAYRYCLLDIGHAWESLALAARAMGCATSATGDFSDDDIASLCRISEDEWPLLLLQVKGDCLPLRPADSGPVVWSEGRPNPLSDAEEEYPLLRRMHAATKRSESAGTPWTEAVSEVRLALRPARPFGEVTRHRRSALDFIGGTRQMAREDLMRILAAAAPHSIDLYLYAHRVQDLEPGVYEYDASALKLKTMWTGDQRVIAAGLSLQQELAGNACVAFSLIAPLEQITAQHGNRGYRYAHFEAGAIGQRLYLAAEALGFAATGMGAFFDDEVHSYLKLTPEHRQVVYHFAIGYPVPDPRVEATG